MSVGPSWPRSDPSTNSTSECTMLCGWTTTSIASGAMPNSQWASMTSSPLFMSVAESIVTLGPIAHVGWRRASAGPTVSRASAGRRRKGPPDAVSQRRATSWRARPSRHWKIAECSLSTGSRRARVLCTAAVTRLPGDQRFLGREGHVLSPAERGHRGGEPRRSCHGHQDQVGARVRGQGGEPLGTHEDLPAPAGGASAQPGGPFRGPDRDRRRSVLAHLLDQPRNVGAPRQRHHLHLAGTPLEVPDHVERGAADGAGRAQDGETARHAFGHHSIVTYPTTLANRRPSKRSRIPPCPGRIRPASFTPTSRLIADSQRSPKMLAPAHNPPTVAAMGSGIRNN